MNSNGDRLADGEVVKPIPTAEAVLALLLQGNQEVYNTKDINPEDFSKSKLMELYKAINSLRERGIKIDGTTILSELDLSNSLQEIGGADIINSLLSAKVSHEMASDYIQCLRAESQKRRQISEVEALAKAVKIGENIEVPLQKIRDSLVAATNVDSSAGELIHMLMKSLQNPAEGPTGIESMIPELNEATCGLQPGDLIILAARPSMGKTAMAINCIGQNAARQGICVGVFSLEMSKKGLMERILSNESRIFMGKVRDPRKLTDQDWPALTEASNRITRMPLYIDDTGGLELDELCSRARRWVCTKGVKLIIIDYLQLVRNSRTTESRQLVIAEISRSLKALAKELNVPILALSQLNRESEKRPDKRPMMSDLRESGAIEQDADLVIFLHRESVYCNECRSPDMSCTKGHDKDAELIIGKARNGETAIIPVYFDGSIQTFGPRKELNYQKDKEGKIRREADEEHRQEAAEKFAAEQARQAAGDAAKRSAVQQSLTMATSSTLFENIPRNKKFSNLGRGAIK